MTLPYQLTHADESIDRTDRSDDKMCTNCPHRDEGYCGYFDLTLIEKNGTFEPLYECMNQTEAD